MVKTALLFLISHFLLMLYVLAPVLLYTMKHIRVDVQGLEESAVSFQEVNYSAAER